MDGEQVWRDAYALIRQEVGVWVRRQPASTSGGRKRQLGVVGVFIVLVRAGGNGPKPSRRHSLQAARETNRAQNILRPVLGLVARSSSRACQVLPPSAVVRMLGTMLSTFSQ